MPAASVRKSARRRVLLLFVAGVALFAPILSSGRAQDVLNGIAAVVNDDVITFSQVRDLVAAKEKAAREQFKGEELVQKVKEIRLQAVNDLIDRQLILQEFKRMEKNGAKIPEHVVEEHIETIVREEFGNDRAAFIRTLQAEGFTLDRFRQMELDKIIVQAMRSQLVKTSGIVPEPKITETYQQNIAQYTSEEQAKIRMLVIKKGEGANSRRGEVDEIRQKIAGGAAFEDLARLYSEDSSTQEAGGDLGWINRKYLNETLTKAAFSLKPGEVSKVVDYAGNYYIFLCEARKGAVTRPLVQVHDEIEKNIAQLERQKAQQEWVAKMRKKAFIKIF